MKGSKPKKDVTEKPRGGSAKKDDKKKENERKRKTDYDDEDDEEDDETENKEFEDYLLNVDNDYSSNLEKSDLLRKMKKDKEKEASIREKQKIMMQQMIEKATGDSKGREEKEEIMAYAEGDDDNKLEDDGYKELDEEDEGNLEVKEYDDEQEEGEDEEGNEDDDIPDDDEQVEGKESEEDTKQKEYIVKEASDKPGRTEKSDPSGDGTENSDRKRKTKPKKSVTWNDQAVAVLSKPNAGRRTRRGVQTRSSQLEAEVSVEPGGMAENVEEPKHEDSNKSDHKDQETKGLSSASAIAENAEELKPEDSNKSDHKHQEIESTSYAGGMNENVEKPKHEDSNKSDEKNEEIEDSRHASGMAENVEALKPEDSNTSDKKHAESEPNLSETFAADNMVTHGVALAHEYKTENLVELKVDISTTLEEKEDAPPPNKTVRQLMPTEGGRHTSHKRKQSPKRISPDKKEAKDDAVPESAKQTSAKRKTENNDPDFVPPTLVPDLEQNRRQSQRIKSRLTTEEGSNKGKKSEELDEDDIPLSKLQQPKSKKTDYEEDWPLVYMKHDLKPCSVNVKKVKTKAELKQKPPPLEVEESGENWFTHLQKESDINVQEERNKFLQEEICAEGGALFDDKEEDMTSFYSQCTICGKETFNLKDQIIHFNEHCEFFCTACQFPCSDLEEYKYHMQVKHGQVISTDVKGRTGLAQSLIRGDEKVSAMKSSSLAVTESSSAHALIQVSDTINQEVTDYDVSVVVDGSGSSAEDSPDKKKDALLSPKTRENISEATYIRNVTGYKCVSATDIHPLHEKLKRYTPKQYTPRTQSERKRVESYISSSCQDFKHVSAKDLPSEDTDVTDQPTSSIDSSPEKKVPLKCTEYDYGKSETEITTSDQHLELDGLADSSSDSAQSAMEKEIHLEVIGQKLALKDTKENVKLSVTGNEDQQSYADFSVTECTAKCSELEHLVAVTGSNICLTSSEEKTSKSEIESERCTAVPVMAEAQLMDTEDQTSPSESDIGGSAVVPGMAEVDVMDTENQTSTCSKMKDDKQENVNVTDIENQTSTGNTSCSKTTDEKEKKKELEETGPSEGNIAGSAVVPGMPEINVTDIENQTSTCSKTTDDEQEKEELDETSPSKTKIGGNAAVASTTDVNVTDIENQTSTCSKTKDDKQEKEELDEAIQRESDIGSSIVTEAQSSGSLSNRATSQIQTEETSLDVLSSMSSIKENDDETCSIDVSSVRTDYSTIRTDDSSTRTEDSSSYKESDHPESDSSNDKRKKIEEEVPHSDTSSSPVVRKRRKIKKKSSDSGDSGKECSKTRVTRSMV